MYSIARRTPPDSPRPRNCWSARSGRARRIAAPVARSAAVDCESHRLREPRRRLAVSQPRNCASRSAARGGGARGSRLGKALRNEPGPMLDDDRRPAPRRTGRPPAPASETRRSRGAAVVPASGPGRSRTARPRRLETAASPAIVSRARRAMRAASSRQAVACRRPAARDTRTDRPQETNSGPAPDRAAHCRETSSAASAPSRTKACSRSSAGSQRLDQAAVGSLERSSRIGCSRRRRHSFDVGLADRRGIGRAVASSRWLFSGTVKKSPVERLVLAIVLAQRQRRHRLGHFVAQVERVAGVDRPRGCGLQLLEQRERIGVASGACRRVTTCSWPSSANMR